MDDRTAPADRHTRARCAGALTALVLVALAVPAAAMRPSWSPGATDVTITVAPTGELAVERSGAVVAVSALAPGGEVGGDFAVRNQTGSRLGVRLRALPSSPTLDHVLRVKLRSDGQPLFDGTLGQLRGGTVPVGLDAGRRAKVAVALELVAPVAGGPVVDVPIELETAVEDR